MKDWMPKTSEVARETITIILASMIASVVIGHMPEIKAWWKKVTGT